ncbi:hypothetical protein FRC12_010420 [Ceratobasidium sp. 428]|nr:hypothetical protein FRC12_010420 [Ceratobasidium sp. 428]
MSSTKELSPTTGPQTSSEKLSQNSEKVNQTFIPPVGTVFGTPQPVLGVTGVNHDDDLFPENFRGWLVVLGCFIMSSSDSNELTQILAWQGILQGLANGLALPFIFAYPSQWFKRRRGLASGIVAGGSSFGGGASTLILRAMLTRLAFRDALIIYAGIHFVLLSIAVCLIKEGPGVVVMRTTRTESRWVDKDLLRDPVFWCATMSLCLSVFGFLSPYFLMPTYAISLIPSLTPQYSVLPMSIMNFMSALGRSLVGFLADLIGPANAFILAVTISALSQLVIWNFAYNYATIMVFSVIFAAQLFGTSNLAGLVGTFTFLITPGDLAGTPIAGIILNATGRN